MDDASLLNHLEKKLGGVDAWLAYTIGADADILRNANLIWDKLEPELRLKLLTSFVGFRDRERQKLDVYMKQMIELGLNDEDDWVRTTASILKPLLSQPPEAPELMSEQFQSSVKMVSDKLEGKLGGLDFRQVEDAFLDLSLIKNPPANTGLCVFSVNPEHKIPVVVPVKPAPEAKKVVTSGTSSRSGSSMFLNSKPRARKRTSEYTISKAPVPKRVVKLLDGGLSTDYSPTPLAKPVALSNPFASNAPAAPRQSAAQNPFQQGALGALAAPESAPANPLSSVYSQPGISVASAAPNPLQAAAQPHSNPLFGGTSSVAAFPPVANPLMGGGLGTAAPPNPLAGNPLAGPNPLAPNPLTEGHPAANPLFAAPVSHSAPSASSVPVAPSRFGFAQQYNAAPAPVVPVQQAGIHPVSNSLSANQRRFIENIIQGGECPAQAPPKVTIVMHNETQGGYDVQYVFECTAVPGKTTRTFRFYTRKRKSKVQKPIQY